MPIWRILLRNGQPMTTDQLPLSWLQAKGIGADEVAIIELAGFRRWIGVNLTNGNLYIRGKKIGHYAGQEPMDFKGLPFLPIAKRRGYKTLSAAGDLISERYLYIVGWRAGKHERYVVTDGKRFWMGA